MNLLSFELRSNNKKEEEKETYNTRDSPVVTDLSTNLAISSLSMGERTGSRIFCYVWSYVLEVPVIGVYMSRIRVLDFAAEAATESRRSVDKSSYYNEILQ